MENNELHPWNTTDFEEMQLIKTKRNVKGIETCCMKPANTYRMDILASDGLPLRSKWLSTPTGNNSNDRDQKYGTEPAIITEDRLIRGSKSFRKGEVKRFDLGGTDSISKYSL